MKLRSILGLGALVALAVWLAAWGENWSRAYAFTGRQGDYYNLLVHGFLRGHLSMDAAVDPRALNPDPVIRRQAAIEADASLYHGRYYLYFGVVPAALLLLPYRLATGQDLSENAACLCLVLMGFLFYAKIYAQARRRYFPALSWPLRAASVFLLALGTGTPSLLILSGRYEIAIAGGYAAMAGAWLAFYRALHSERRAATWLGVAGAAFGLAVGCRPTYLLMVPALAVGTLLFLRLGGPVNSGRAGLRLIAAAVLPAALIGLLLAGYNYARFGNPLEFGFSYQPNNSDLLAIGQSTSAARIAFFWPNLKGYYLQWPTLSPYFPYIFPLNFKNPPPGYVGGEASHGQWPTSLLLLCCALGALSFCRKPAPIPGRLAALLVALAAGFAGMFAGLACFSTITNRYLVDFQGSLALLLAIAGGYAAVAAPWGRHPLRTWRICFGILATATGLFSLLASLQLADRFEQTRPRTFGFLAHYGNYPAGLLAKWGWLRSGPARFSLTFAPVARPTMRPVLATGVPGYTDVLYVIQHPQGLAQFMILHEGHGEFRSALIPIALGRAYPMVVEMGSLYPPADSPFFAGWPAGEVETLKTRARVEFAGQTVIHQKAPFYDSPPNWVSRGENPAGPGLPFTGAITSWRRLPPPSPAAAGSSPADLGAWRLQVKWPLSSPQIGHPLLGSGTREHGNLLLMQATPDGRLRFSLDEWNHAFLQSPALAAPVSGLHTIEIFAGPQVARQALPADWHLSAADVQAVRFLLRVWLDGQPIWTAQVDANLETYAEVSLGANPQGFSTADSYFLGSLANLPYSASEMQKFIETNVRRPAEGKAP
jgi:hypothetical protein